MMFCIHKTLDKIYILCGIFTKYDQPLLQYTKHAEIPVTYYRNLYCDDVARGPYP